ncbi:AEC family transporter [Oryzibacter oryziterrae]|uniref:AEC family transporter n=1 Tax=Oryzibacter oryziterrae TaxID=2766474 RepID=UPI001F490F64|nr:AEC family transporter [Oryzibacter oryziterrae]
MLHVLSLAAPFFGVILIGFASGKIARLPQAGLAWLDFFLVYVALPALFFDLVHKTPVQELTRVSYVAATTTATFITFVISLFVGRMLSRGTMREATIQGVIGSYANVGYMGPGLTLGTLGAQAAAPTALIFCFDVTLIFTLLPVMMAIFGEERRSFGATLLLVLRRVFLHPFIFATLLGGVAALLSLDIPTPIQSTLTFLRGSAAPTALFALGVTVALQPAGHGVREMPVLIFIKLLVHPLIAWTMVTLVGGFEPVWIYTAVLMASLPTAATTYVAALQYDTYVARAATSILFGTTASMITVTAAIYLVTHHLIPLGF